MVTPARSDLICCIFPGTLKVEVTHARACAQPAPRISCGKHCRHSLHQGFQGVWGEVASRQTATSGTAAAILSAPALWHAIFHPFCHLCCTPTPNHTPELVTLQCAFCMRESLNSLRICEQTFSIFLLPSIWKFGACTMHQSGPWIKIPKSRGGCHWIGRGSINNNTFLVNNQSHQLRALHQALCN